MQKKRKIQKIEHTPLSIYNVHRSRTSPYIPVGSRRIASRQVSWLRFIISLRLPKKSVARCSETPHHSGGYRDGFAPFFPFKHTNVCTVLAHHIYVFKEHGVNHMIHHFFLLAYPVYKKEPPYSEGAL
ncbi:hypothetical protein HNR43_000277 [Anoxybacillus mongoliensis]|uniref:Uncharacterized protein n=1 Tax=Anoxybacillus mongoliensis TaxID=452565 RepID=A0A7W8JCD0_9BACL|nr:hypothetical protein [Anoxybacillus mongoliensis]